MTETTSICFACGQLKGVDEYDAKLQEIYERVDLGGRQYIEPLVFTAEEFEESYDPERDDFTAMEAMGRNMAERGLCPECGRPDLSRVTPEQILPEDEARELREMYAEQAAEIRAGC